MQSGKPSKTSSALCKTAIRYYSSQFLTTKQLNDIEVILKFVSPSYFEHPDMYAYCDYLDYRARPRLYEIVIDKGLSQMHTLKYLGHEVVHLKQFYLNEIKYRAQKIVWKNEPIEESMAYDHLPWEIEARGYENELYRRFKSTWGYRNHG